MLNTLSVHPLPRRLRDILVFPAVARPAFRPESAC